MQQRTATQGMSWRQRVRLWLQDVQRDARFSNYQLAAQNRRGSFPASLWVAILKHVWAAVARYVVKSAIQDAAAELGISMSNELASAIAAIIVEAI